jgi:arginase family enzyme
MNFKDYFDPIEFRCDEFSHLRNTDSRLCNIQINPLDYDIEELRKYDIAIVGVPEERNTISKGCALAPDLIRKKLYCLFKPNINANIVDMGNLKNGATVNDTYIGLSDVIYELARCKTIPIIIGGSQDLIYASYLALEEFNRKYNIVSIDSKIDLSDNLFNSESYLFKLFSDDNSNLFNFTNLGYQTYFVDPTDLNRLKKMFFDAIRLGILRANIDEAEPVLRDADIVSFNIGAVRQADAPANFAPSPNGLTGEEACQIARYAGMSDRLRSFGIYEINPEFDTNSQTEHLAAQIIWYFIEGYYQRKHDYPASNIEHCVKFIVNMETIDHEIVFYKSKKSSRWWLEIPSTGNRKKRIVACTHDDYLKTCNQELPDRWWKSVQREN